LKLILLGPPGAGKGTQCKRISEKYRLTHLSSGDILRAERAAGSDLGQKAQAYMDAGALVPDDLIIDMMIKAIKQASGAGWLLDGFPRTLAQAEGLDEALKKADERIDAVLDLQVPDSAILERMTGRRSCPTCGGVYHVKYNPPRQDGVCDNDQTPLVQRKDDTPEVVSNRLKTYHEQTEAVVGYYRRNGGRVLEIDADKPIDQVTGEILEALEKRER